MKNSDMCISSIKEEWDKVMTQAKFIINNDGSLTFLGSEGGYVIVDASTFVDSIISANWAEKKSPAKQ